MWSDQTKFQISTEQDEQQRYRCMDNAFPRNWSGSIELFSVQIDVFFVQPTVERSQYHDYHENGKRPVQIYPYFTIG